MNPNYTTEMITAFLTGEKEQHLTEQFWQDVGKNEKLRTEVLALQFFQYIEYQDTYLVYLKKVQDFDIDLKINTRQKTP